MILYTARRQGTTARLCKQQAGGVLLSDLYRDKRRPHELTEFSYRTMDQLVFLRQLGGQSVSILRMSETSENVAQQPGTVRERGHGS